MLDGKKAYALARKYVDDSLAGAGAVAGVPCQIQSITPITGGNRVTFLWEDNNGDSHTSTMDVKDGEKGETGETGATGNGIKSMTINSAGHVIVTYDNDDTEDAGLVPTVQADWNEADTTANSYIKNKPTLGTASAKDSTDTVRPNSHDLVESNAVANAINQALTSVYTPRGDLSCAELTSELLIAENVGNVYEMSDAGTTSALFIQGAGIPISQGNNVGIIKASADTYMFNYMGNSFDLHDYQKKDLASSVEGASTVEGALGALSENKMPWSANSVLGAKNLLRNTATSQTINSVAFTVNSDDKTVNVTRTAEQTEIATRDLYVVSDEDYKLLAGKTLLMTGCPSGGSNDTYYLECYYNDGTGHWLRDIGDGLTITLPAIKPTTIKFLIGIKVASVIPSDGLTFKPMLRLASDPDNTYVPYAKTNKELTEDVIALQNGAGLPKKTLIRTLANGEITVTIPKNLGSSYAQGSLKLIGSNADSEAHVTFCLNADNTAVTVSKLTNLGSKELTLDSASISGANLVLEISGVQNYAWVSAEYFMSLSAGANAIQPTWTFAGS